MSPSFQEFHWWKLDVAELQTAGENDAEVVSIEKV